MALVGGDEQRPETFRGKFQCNTCGNSLASLKNLTRHMEKLHGRVEITCQICDLTLYSKVEFKEHSLTHVISKNSDIEIQSEGDHVMVASEHFQPDGSVVWLQQESLIELHSGSAVVKLQPKCHEEDLANQDQVLISALELLRSQAEKLNSAKVIVESLPQNTVLETIVLESHQANSQDHVSASLTDVHSDSIIQIGRDNCQASEIEHADLAKEVGAVEPAMEVHVDASEVVNSAVQESIAAITELNAVTLESSLPNLHGLSSELDGHKPVDVYSSHANEPVILTSGTHTSGKEYASFVMHSDDGQKINLTNQEYQTLNTALSLLKSDEPKPIEPISQEKETTTIEISIADLQEESVQSESTKDQEKPTLGYDETTTQPKQVEPITNEGYKSVDIAEILQSTVFDKTVEHSVALPPLDGVIEANELTQQNDLSSNKQDNEAVIAASVDSTSMADKEPGFEFNNQNIEAFQVPLLELSGEPNHEEISCTSESHVDATAVQHDNVAVNDKHGLVAIDFEAAVADALSTDTHAEPLETHTVNELTTTVEETQITTETPVLSEMEGGTFVTDQFGPVQFVIQGDSDSYNINDSDILSHLQSILKGCSNETKGEPSLVQLFRCDEQTQPSTSSEQTVIPVAAPEEEQLKKVDLPVANPLVTTKIPLPKKTATKRRTCGICRTDFGTTKELNAHKMQSHKIVGRKPKRLVCQVCDRPFNSISALYGHMRIHSNEKPFLCHVCDKSFSKHGNLYIHQLSHDKNKFFLCEYCGRSYSRPHSLSHHLLSLHNVKQDCKISDVFSKKDWQQYTSHLRDKTSILYSEKDPAQVVVKKGKASPSKDILNDQEVDLLDDGYAAVVDSDEASVSSESDSWINADLPTHKNKGSDIEEPVADPSDEDIVSSTSESSIDDNVSEVDEEDEEDGLAKLRRVEKNFAKLDKKVDKDMAELGINSDSLGSEELKDQQSSPSNDSESEDEVPLVARAKKTQPKRLAKRPTISSNLMDVLEQSADKIFENITRPRPRDNPPIKSKTLQPIVCEDPDEPNNEEEMNLMAKLEQSARILFKESFIEPLNSVKEASVEHNISFRFDEETLENTDHNALVSNSVLDKNTDSITFNKNLENPTNDLRKPNISLITPRSSTTFRPIQSSTASQSFAEQPQLVRISPLTFQSENPKKAVKTTKVGTPRTKKMYPVRKSKVTSEETKNVDIPKVIETSNINQFSSEYRNWLAKIPGKIQKARKSFPNASIGSSFIKVMDSVESQSPSNPPTPVSITGSPQLTPVKLDSPKPSAPVAKTVKKTVATSKKIVTKTKGRNTKAKSVPSAKSKPAAKRNLSASLNTNPPNEIIASLQSKSLDREKNLEDTAKYGENENASNLLDTSTFKTDTNSQNDEPVPETSSSTVATNQGLDVSSIKKLIQDVLDEQKLEQSESVAESNQATKSKDAELLPGQSVLKKKTNEPKKAISKIVEPTPILAVNPLSRSTMQPITKPLQAVVPTVKLDPKLVTDKSENLEEPKVNRASRSKMVVKKVNVQPLVTELVKKKPTVTKSRLQKAKKSFPGSATSNEMKMVVAEALVDIEAKKTEIPVKVISKSPLDTLNILMQGLVNQNQKAKSVVSKPQTNTDCKERFTLPRLENQSKNMVHTAFLIRPAERANEPMPVFVYNKPGNVGSEDPKIKGVIIVPTLPSAVPSLMKNDSKPEMKTKVTNVVPPSTSVSDNESTKQEDCGPTMRLRNRNKNQENVTASSLASGTTSASTSLDLPILTSTPKFIRTPKTGSKKNQRLTVEINSQPSLTVLKNTSTSKPSTPSSETVKTVQLRGKLSVSSLVGSKKTSPIKLRREIPQKLRISEDLSSEADVNITKARKTYTRSSVSPNLGINLISSEPSNDLERGLNYDDKVLFDQLDTKSCAKTDLVPAIFVATCSNDIVSSSESNVVVADLSCSKSSETSTISITTRSVSKKKPPAIKTVSNISKPKRNDNMVNVQETQPVTPIKLGIHKKTKDRLQNVTPRRSARKIELSTKLKSKSVESRPKKSKLAKNKVEKSSMLTKSPSTKSVSFADQVENRKTPSKVVVPNSLSMPIVPLRPTFDIRYFKHKRKFKAYKYTTDAQNREAASKSQNSAHLTDLQSSLCERPTEITETMNVIAKSPKRGLKRITAKSHSKEVLVESEESRAYKYTDAQNLEAATTKPQNSTQMMDLQASSCERPSTEIIKPMNVIAKSPKRALKRTTAKNQSKEVHVLLESDEPRAKRKNIQVNQDSAECSSTSVNSADIALKSKIKPPKSSVTQNMVSIKLSIPSVTQSLSAIRKITAPIEQRCIPKKRIKSASGELNLSTTYIIVKDPFVNVDIKVPVTSYVTSLKRARVQVENCSALVSPNLKEKYIYHLKKL